MHSRLPKAMLIDLDDTILAYETGAGDVWIGVCQEYIDDLPGWTVAQLVDGSTRTDAGSGPIPNGTGSAGSIWSTRGTRSCWAHFGRWASTLPTSPVG